jgi:tetrahydromethanopterin S-methyltransferase subunit G
MEQKVVQGTSRYGVGVIVGILIGIALFMVTYWLLLLAR